MKVETKKLPEWATILTDEQWARKAKQVKGLSNCAICGKRLIMTLCRDDEPKRYCVEHCPEHKWQSDYDWQTECGRCGISYVTYLQSLLEKNDIMFDKP